MAQKRAELAPALNLDWHMHDEQLSALEGRLEKEYQSSPLPEERDRQAINDFLVRVRLARGRSP